MGCAHCDAEQGPLCPECKPFGSLRLLTVEELKQRGAIPTDEEPTAEELRRREGEG